MKQSIELKRNKIKDAFDLIKISLKNLTSGEDNSVYDCKLNKYIRSEFEYVVTYDIFNKLMTNVNEKLTENQINIIFDLLDLDGNKLLGNEYIYVDMSSSNFFFE